MTENVANLQTCEKPVLPVDEELVSLMRNMLDLAERGEIQGACLITINSDGAGNLIASGSAYAGQGVMQNAQAAVGALEALKMRFIMNLRL